mgnify:CR=1 FL=1
MSASDAFIVGESWISEHYFTSDSTKESFHSRVLARRKDWDNASREGEETIRSCFSAHRRELLTEFSALSANGDGQTPEDLHTLYKDFLTIFGYQQANLSREASGPLITVASAGLENSPSLIIVEARPVSDVTELLAKDAETLLRPFIDDDEPEPVCSVARLLSREFVSDNAPKFALVLAGGTAMIAERTRWAEGRYLAIDLAVVCDRNEDRRGGEIDRALTCLSAESLAPDAQGSIWW